MLSRGLSLSQQGTCSGIQNLHRSMSFRAEWCVYRAGAIQMVRPQNLDRNDVGSADIFSFAGFSR